MNKYQKRKITYKELVKVNDWQVKVYTIVKSGEFSNPQFYDKVLKELPLWLKEENSFNSENERIAFLILHAGSEGIFSIINWWVGENMLNSNIYITKKDDPELFEKISGDGLAPCIWELEIINFERLSWLNNVLRKAPEPDFNSYIGDHFEKEI